MKITLGGARGSLPVSGGDTRRYGGDTFSLLLEGRTGEQILVDAGSGIQNLRERLRPGSRLFFTHTHLDHLVGLPLLGAAWPREMVFPRGDLADVLRRVFSPPVWPVPLPTTSISSPTVPPVESDGFRVFWHAVAHPDGCLAYRVEEPASGHTVVIATDLEWPALDNSAQDAFVQFAAGADLLLFDAQYLPAEYATHRGWGHSTWEHAVEVARRATAARLWLMHHDPERTDPELDAIVADARQAFPKADMAFAGATWPPA